MSLVTEDWLLNEQVRIFQPEKGYRAGLDAIPVSYTHLTLPTKQAV